MKQAIQLSNPSGEATVVKTAALLTFRGLRALAGYVAELPAVATKVADDVGEAWRESANVPKS
jgi:hypothetical protein